MLAETAWQPAENPRAFICGPTALVETVATSFTGTGLRAATNQDGTIRPNRRLELWMITI